MEHTIHSEKLSEDIHNLLVHTKETDPMLILEVVMQNVATFCYACASHEESNVEPVKIYEAAVYRGKKYLNDMNPVHKGLIALEKILKEFF